MTAENEVRNRGTEQKRDGRHQEIRQLRRAAVRTHSAKSSTEVIAETLHVETE